MGAFTSSNNSIGGVKYGSAFAPFSGLGDSPNTSQFENTGDLNQFGRNPMSSRLDSMVSSLKAPTLDYNYTPYEAKDVSKTDLPQFDAMRSRLQQQYAQRQSQGQDSLDRQFAAMDGGPGNGAQAKQTENLAAGLAAQQGQDTADINAQEAQTRFQMGQQEAQRAFQSGESAKEAGLSEAEQNAQMNQAEDQFKTGAMFNIAGLNTSWDQAQAEAANNEYNKRMADYKAQHSGGLLGGGGFLGTGFGA